MKFTYTDDQKIKIVTEMVENKNSLLLCQNPSRKKQAWQNLYFFGKSVGVEFRNVQHIKDIVKSWKRSFISKKDEKSTTGNGHVPDYNPAEKLLDEYYHGHLHNRSMTVWEYYSFYLVFSSSLFIFHSSFSWFPLLFDVWFCVSFPILFPMFFGFLSSFLYSLISIFSSCSFL